MLKWLAVGAACAAALILPRPAMASSDWWRCEVHWQVESSWRECGGLGLLRPGNDTRLNLFLLLGDRRGGLPAGFGYPKQDKYNRSLGHVFTMWGDLRGQFLPAEQPNGSDPGYSFGGGACAQLSRTRADFAAALAANPGVPAKERVGLNRARVDLEAGCADPTMHSEIAQYALQPPVPVWPEGIASAAGQEFLNYLKSALAYYQADWAVARPGFAALEHADDPWVAEAAKYMAIRLELDSALVPVADKYGYLSNRQLDQAAVHKGAEAIAAYQQAYPHGRYFASAENAKRRVLALNEDWTGLAGVLSGLTRTGPRDGFAAAELVKEIDIFLMGSGKKYENLLADPMLLAVWDLKAMRFPPKEEVEGGAYYLYDQPDDSIKWPMLSRKQLEAQKPAFEGQDELYTFLDATFAFYHERDFKRVLSLIPARTGAKSYTALELSRQALRAMALGKLGDPQEVAEWTELLAGAGKPYGRQAIELGLAIAYERSGRLAEMFGPHSPLKDTTVRSRVLQFAADRLVLRKAALDRSRPGRERDMAAFTLLFNELRFGDYTHFIADRSVVRPDAPAKPWFYNLATREEVPAGLFVRGPFSRGPFQCPDLGVTARQLAANRDNPHALLCLAEFWRLGGFDTYFDENVQPIAGEVGMIRPQVPRKELWREDIYLKVLANKNASRGDHAYALVRAIWCYASSSNINCRSKGVDDAQRKAWFVELKTRYADTPYAKLADIYW